MHTADKRLHQEDIVYRTLLILCAIAIHAIEFFLPRIPFFPWLKPGLSNVITVLWIIKFGMIDALLLVLLRVWIAGFYFGFSFITLTLSCSGGLAATLAMGILWKIAGEKKLIGTIGISIIGAFVHNVTQLSVVHLLLAHSVVLFYQIPAVCLASLGFGTIVGLLVPYIDSVVNSIYPTLPDTLTIPRSSRQFKRFDIFSSTCVLGTCVALLFLNNLLALAVFATILTVLVFFILRTPLKTLTYPVRRFWIIFLGVALIYLFFTPGTSYTHFPMLTHEGVLFTSRQWLRIWCWLQLSLTLHFFNFHHITFSVLSRIFRAHHSTLYAGILALEYFPHTLQTIKDTIRISPKKLFFHPATYITDTLRSGFISVAQIMKQSKETTV